VEAHLLQDVGRLENPLRDEIQHQIATQDGPLFVRRRPGEIQNFSSTAFVMLRGHYGNFVLIGQSRRLNVKKNSVL
jgi:hypothetical protein